MIERHTTEAAPPSVSASWSELLLMAYDRLVLDVERGLQAQRQGERQETLRHLGHAVDIVSELQRSMRMDDFKGGYDLASLYEFLNRQLVRASLRQDEAITDDCLALVTDLCNTWRHMAQALSADLGQTHRIA